MVIECVSHTQPSLAALARRIGYSTGDLASCQSKWRQHCIMKLRISAAPLNSKAALFQSKPPLKRRAAHCGGEGAVKEEESHHPHGEGWLIDQWNRLRDMPNVKHLPTHTRFTRDILDMLHNLPIHKSAPSVGARQLWTAKPGLWSKRGKRHLGGHGAEKTLLPAPLLLPPLISIHPSKRKKCQWRFSPPHKYGPSLVMREGGGHLPCHPRVS